jgi:RNA polymerase sigma-70 factor (ECF subfamily)
MKAPRLFEGEQTSVKDAAGTVGGSLDPNQRKSRLAEAEFEELYAHHSRELWALVYARCLNSDTAQEIVQEAFLRLWREWQRGAVIAHPRAWLLRVAANLAEDHAKSAFHRNGTCAPEQLSGVMAQSTLPLLRVERLDVFDRIHSVLREVAQADREILTLRYALDYDTARIASVLGISATAVHMRLSRARQRIAEKLANHGITEYP